MSTTFCKALPLASLLVTTPQVASAWSPQYERLVAPSETFEMTGLSRDGTTFIGSEIPYYCECYAATSIYTWASTRGFETCPTGLPLAHAGPSSLSADGSVLIGEGSGYRRDAGGAFYWRRGDPQVSYLPFRSDSARGVAISASGNAFLWSNTDSWALGTYLWDGSVMQRLSTYGTDFAAISDGARTVAFRNHASGTFQRWTRDHGVQSLETGEGFEVHGPPAISSDGSIVYAIASRSDSSFLLRWTFDAGTLLNRSELAVLPGGLFKGIAGVSADGRIIAFSADRPSLWIMDRGVISLADYLRERGIAWDDSVTSNICGMSETALQFAGNEWHDSGDSALWYVNLDPAIPAFCPSDLNHDRSVDDSDFVEFVMAYAAFSCPTFYSWLPCPADLDHDHLVDDADFVLFSAAYDNLLCP